MIFRRFAKLVLVILFLSHGLWASGNSGLRVLEIIDGQEVLSTELDIEFVFSALRQNFSETVVLVNTSDKDITIRLKPGSTLKGKQFEIKGVKAGFQMRKGERKTLEMTYLSSNQNFVNWETGFIVVSNSGLSDGVLLNCVARKDLSINLDNRELLAWDEARKLHSLESYTNFLQSFPASSMVKEAELRIVNIRKDSLSGRRTTTDKKFRSDLEKVAKTNNEQAIRSFLQKHDNFPFKTGLERHIETLKERTVFEHASKSSDQEALREYLRKYPDGMFTYFVKDELNERVVIPAKIKEGINEIKGQLLYFIPDSMTVNEAYRVDMTIQRIGNSKIKIEKGRSLLKIPNVVSKTKTRENTDVTIEIGKVMRAELIDSSPEKRFHVVPFGESEKLVDLTGKDLTLWQWDVVPLEAGRHYLNFLVEIIMTTAEGTFSEAIPVYKKKIYVESVPGFWAKNGLPIGGVAGLLIVLVMAFFWNKKRKTSDDYVEAKARKISAIPERVLFLVKNNKIKLALVALDEFLNIDDDLTKDVVLLKSSFSALTEQIEEGTISEENAQLETNRIRSSIVELADLLTARK